MNRPVLIVGIILVVAGAAIYAYFSNVGRHHIIPLGGIGLAVLGVLIVIGGVMLKRPGAPVASQFKCAKCGATFGNQAALDQHTKDKHGM